MPLTKRKKLHGALDELVADYVSKTGMPPSKTSILKLLQWSHAQIEKAKKGKAT